MATGYQVDLDQLRGTVSKLQAIADGLDSTHAKATYNTSIAPGTLGTGFTGAEELHAAHETMKTWIADMIKKLQAFINTHGEQTKQAADGYEGQEQQTKQGLFSL